MNIRFKMIVATILSGLLTSELAALEVDREVTPRMTLGGRLISTVDSLDLESETEAEDGINLSDSSLLTRFDKRLYSDGVAGAVVGFSENESDVMFHQLHAFYWNQNFSAELGRVRLRNTLLEFPLIRDDDLLSYTHVGNGSSDEELDQIYGKHLALDWFIDQKIQTLGVWAGTRRNGEAAEFDNAPDGLDSVGFGYVYEQPEDLLYVSKIRHAGLRLDRQKVKEGDINDWMTAIIAGVELNLNRDPTKNWSFAAQAILNNGIDDVASLESTAKQAQAKSTALVTSVRYTGRPKLLTRYQAGLTLAYKDYSDIDSASQWSVVPSVMYRLGQGVDLLGQVSYTRFEDGIGINNSDSSDTAVQFGIAFSLEAVFNDNIGERDSILNLEHGYIK